MTTWPTETELQAFLTGAGVLPNPIDDSVLVFLEFQDVLDAAQEEFEGRVGWRPFLAGTDPETRVYDPPGPKSSNGPLLASLQGGERWLSLDGGLLRFDSLTISGATYEKDTQFWLRPANAAAKKKPYTDIEFLTAVYGLPNAVAVTGIWGRVSALPADVRRTVLQRAAQLLAPQISLAITGGVMRRKEGDVEVEYARSTGTGLLINEAEAWDTHWEQTVTRYKRMIIR